MRTALAPLAMVALAACVGEPTIVSSTTDNVTLQYSGDQSSDAEARARTQCGNYGKRARLRSVSTQPDGQRMAIYDCVM